MDRRARRTGEGSLFAALVDIWQDFAGSPETRLRISGDSMLPTLPSGCEVVVRHGVRDLAPGAIIAFHRRGAVIVHRLVAINRGPLGRVFVTKGDNNPVCDPAIPEADVLGRVVAAEWAPV